MTSSGRAPSPTPTHRAEILILGGGIAGLWILDRLRRLGRDARLFDLRGSGAEEEERQTLYCQGILHRGAKYLLRPASDPSDPFPDLLPRWRAALEGRAGSIEPDSRAVEVLADGLWLISRAPSAARLPRDLAARLDAARQSGLVRLEEDGPAGARYRLLEPVLEMSSLLTALEEQHADAFGLAAEIEPSSTRDSIRVRVDDQEWQAHRLILAAGSGNGALLRQLGLAQPAMILHPLHMVWLEGGDLPPTWAHILDPEAAPGREGAHLTITSHPDPRGGWRWYVGGDPSELGVQRRPDEQAREIRRLLERSFPEIRFGQVRWRSHRLHKAEPEPPDGRRRLLPFVHRQGPVLTVWPMKMVLAPLLADRVVEVLELEP